MKTTNRLFRTVMILFISAMSFTSCRKDDDSPETKIYPEENPFSAYMASSGFGQKTNNVITNNSSEFGLKFTPLVKGKIKSIVLKIPADDNNVRVTIWNASDKTVLRTETIPSVIANTEVVRDISTLELEKDKVYMITFNGKYWYSRSKTDATSTTYPIVAGNISINGYSWINGTAQIFPNIVENGYYGGDLSFVFQQTE